MQPRNWSRQVSLAAAGHRAMEATMDRLFQAARDGARDVLAALAAAAYFTGFFAAINAALGKLFY
jgi:hypothetical protein